MFEKMIENKYKKRYETQQKISLRKSEEIEVLKSQIKELELECYKKDKIIEAKNRVINSVEPLRNELQKNIDELKGCKVEYKNLIDELKEMKSMMNQDIYNGRWNLIRFLIKLLMK